LRTTRPKIQYHLEKDLCISCQHLAYHEPIVAGSVAAGRWRHM